MLAGAATMKIDEALCGCAVPERVRRVDQNPALPFSQSAQGRLNPGPRHGKKDERLFRSDCDRGRRRTGAKTADHACQLFRRTAVAEDNPVAGADRLACVDVMMLPARTAASAVLAAKKRTRFMAEYLSM